mmetsp:Transcript_29712/g.58991  ORF Transcript_29712/g.58991 Transcript_29712/m.58991 type:complete len:369 (+) Transcript_29712:1772-2878(+)
MSALVLGIVIGMGIARIVMIPRIPRIDGDQRHVAKILAAFQPHGLLRIGLGHHRVRETVGNAVFMDGDQRHGLGRRRVAQTRHDAGTRQADALLGSCQLRLDQLAILGTVGGVAGHAPFAVAAFVDRHNAPTFGSFAEHAQDPARVRADPADQARFIMIILILYQGQPRQNAVALPQGRIRGTRDDQHARLNARAMPLHRGRKKVAIVIRRQHLQHTHRRQPVWVLIGLLALLQMAFGLQLLEQAFEVNPGRPFDAKCFGDVTFRGEGRIGGNPVKDFGLRWDTGHETQVARGLSGVMAKLQGRSSMVSTSLSVSTSALRPGNRARVSASACALDQRAPSSTSRFNRAGWHAPINQNPPSGDGPRTVS